jgi:hypothetical protein
MAARVDRALLRLDFARLRAIWLGLGYDPLRNVSMS